MAETSQRGLIAYFLNNVIGISPQPSSKVGTLTGDKQQTKTYQDSINGFKVL